MITSEQLLAENSISKLTDLEKKHYLATLKDFYEDDEKTCADLQFSHPRWSIIAGYFAMHNLSKYLIGDKLLIKIGDKMTHTSTIVLMNEYVKKEEVKTRVLKLLEEAQKIYDEINKKDWNISKYLSTAQETREKANYYSSEFDKKEIIVKASNFKLKVVEPYMHLLKELLKEKLYDRNNKRV